MRESGIDFKSKSLTLEGVIASPNGLSGALPGVVVCHPHPLFGGDMNNDLVLAVCKSLVQEGFVTLRFNFRGVGTSDGAFSKGDKEREDVAAALNMLRAWPAVDNARLALVGYSFGAAMILKGSVATKLPGPLPSYRHPSPLQGLARTAVPIFSWLVTGTAWCRPLL